MNIPGGGNSGEFCILHYNKHMMTWIRWRERERERESRVDDSIVGSADKEDNPAMFFRRERERKA